MASARNPARPISPHLQIWKWGPHMLVSILHRATGSGMATIGTGLLVWWLVAIASGPETYQTFRDVFTTDAGALNPIGWLFAVGLTLSLFQHMMTGLRHWFLDIGSGYELKRNKMFATLTMVAAVVLTAIYWLYMGTK
ncbi:MAG TPA: succinate dehydrogenase, cytochrome b556 subunit [Sphingomonas sp.]|nr:succinate dehydrogenase, cytochrome b556 subunit [Sphingomonas sp.]